MKYSIIIPVLNEEKLLPQLLKQLNNPQLRKENEFEIVISDGGSKDCTVKIALEQADIVKVHSKKHKQNIAEGRNLGAKHANGEIFIFLNGDVLLKDPIEFFKFVNKRFVNSNYSAMTCFVKIFPSEEKFSDKIYHGLYNIYFCSLNWLGVGMGRGECQIIRREVFQKMNGYNEKLAAGEDFDLFKRIRKHGKILFTNKINVYESPRRFRKFGYANVTWSWLKNSVSVVIKHKSISKVWEQVR